MAWVTKDSTETYNQTPEPPREYTKKEKAANWWHYHWMAVVVAVLVVVFGVWIIKDTVFQTRPDVQVAYVGTSDLPTDTVTALQDALTPFCSCGTTAVVLGAMASSVPWAPVVAFMVSSPLTSPQEYVWSVGLFGPAFATTFFVAAIAAGLASTLIERAADVAIKEGRKLVIVPRETPFSVLHLENMLRLARMGVVILPANPGFYHHPQSVGDLVDFVVARILDQLGVAHALMPRWGEDARDNQREE